MNNGPQKRSVIWKDYRFEVVLKGKKVVQGRIDLDKIKEIPQDFARKTEDIFGSPVEEKALVSQKIEREDLANFIFIRSILDFGGVAPSTVFSERMLNLYQQKRYLFRPKDDVWSELRRHTTLMQVILLPIAGLFRTRFIDITKWWIGFRDFLIRECDGDASNFFNSMTDSLKIDKTRMDALEMLHLSMLKKKIKLPFPYGEKNGRFMFASMSQSRRGYDLMKGITGEHLKDFNLPVDSQVTRVSLNSGVIKLEHIESEKREMLKKTGQGLPIGPYITEICQKAWKLVANKVELFPADLDWYVWSIGSNICKRFGELCFICPIIDVCDSATTGYVKESRGIDWNRGCFSLAKPHPTAFGVIRTCQDCPDYNGVGRICHRRNNYAVKRISSEELELLKQFF